MSDARGASTGDEVRGRRRWYEHAAQMHEPTPDAELAVVPGARHTELTHRTGIVVPMVAAFLRRG